MAEMPIVFIGTPEFAVPSLRRLVADGQTVAAVVTQPDRATGRHRSRLSPSPVKQAALELGLDLLQPASLRDPDAVAALRALAPQVMVVAAFGQILRPDILAIPARGCLNVHASLLPKYRGASPIAAAILAGDSDTGVTIMLMDTGMDTGPVLAARGEPISPQDTTGSLTQRLAETGAELLSQTLPRWLAGQTEPTPQDNAQATVTRLTRKEDGAIDWTLRAEDIWRRVRAYNPWPGAHTTLGGEQVTIRRAWPLESPGKGAPGTIVALPPQLAGEAPDSAFGVCCGEGVLGVIELQRAGRRTVSSAEFLRGAAGLIGKRFGPPDK